MRCLNKKGKRRYRQKLKPKYIAKYWSNINPFSSVNETLLSLTMRIKHTKCKNSKKGRQNNAEEK